MAEEMKTEKTAGEDTKAEKNASASGSGKKKSFWSENKIEVIVAILLGLTAMLSAWASWIGSLHGGVQAINFTKSNNLASEGNSEYNAGVQLYLSDILTWNTLMDYTFDLELAEAEQDQAKIDLLSEKLETYADQNASEILLEGLDWMDQNDAESPFEMPGITEAYFSAAEEKLAESQELLEEGQRDNTKGDAYNLVSVIYSLILFLLGIVGIFKKLPNRVVILLIAAAGLLLATIYMCTIPLPTGFNLGSILAIK